MTLRTVLLSLQALLSAAEPDDPQDAVVARQYKENLEMFQITARHWTNIYAGGKILCHNKRLIIRTWCVFYKMKLRTFHCLALWDDVAILA